MCVVGCFYFVVRGDSAVPELRRRALTTAVGAALAESARDIVLLVALDGRIMFGNAAAVDAYGYERLVLESMTIDDLRANDPQELVRSQMASAAESGILFEAEHRRADGTVFPVEVSSRRVDLDGSAFLLSVVRDITRRRERERTLASLFEDVELANRQLEGLLKIVSSAVGRLDEDVLLRDVLDALVEVLEADMAVMFIREGDVWRLRAADSVSARADLEPTVPAGSGFVSRVAEAGVVSWAEDVTRSPFSLPIHESMGLRSVIGVPLVVEGEIHGVLECFWTRERMTSEAERVMLQVAADRVMNAIVGAERFATTERARVVEAALASAAAALADAHQLDGVLPTSLELVADGLDCDIALFGEFRGGEIRIQAALGTEVSSLILPELRDGVPWPDVRVVCDVDPPGTCREILAQLGAREALVAGVHGRDGWSGALVFARRHGHRGFDAVEVGAARRFGTGVALALVSAHDYQSEHRIAEVMQEAFLRIANDTDKLDIAHLYRSATSATRVGGDFYDVFTLPDGRVVLVVGDVSGKGLDAAVLTSTVKHTVRALAHVDDSLSEVMRRTNDVLAFSGGLPDFVTILVLAVDPETGHGEYVCAGHPPALIVHADGAIERLECTSPVAGALPGLPYTAAQFSVAPGDVVVLYTDGVTEARASDREFFGDERLDEAVRAAATGGVQSAPSAIHDIVMGFTDGHLTDDIAILAFGMRDASIR